MRIVKNVIENVWEHLFPQFKRVATRNENGDLIEKSVQMTKQEIIDDCKIGLTPDGFANSVDRLPDTDPLDKFSAIDQLGLAIAGIQYDLEMEKTANIEEPEIIENE